MAFSSHPNGLVPQSTPRESFTTVNGEQGSSSMQRPSINTPASTIETQAHHTEVNGIGASSTNGIEGRDAILQDQILTGPIDGQGEDRSQLEYTVPGPNGILGTASPPATATPEAARRSSESMPSSVDDPTLATLGNQSGYSHQDTYQHPDGEHSGVLPPAEEAPVPVNHTSRRLQVANWLHNHLPWSPVRRHNGSRRRNGMRRLREVTGLVDRVFHH